MNDTKVKKQIIEKIKDSTNVLVALNDSPTVDELSAALAVTLAINKIDKHATAVFSGDIPAAIEFLEPEKTFENTVSSLQDFIIALDKEKADHLRYKVDGDMVKIFITPYRTTIDEGDLEFSQGDYNVDVVLAIGVNSADSLDKALAAHGKILEDATVIGVSLDGSAELGSINMSDSNASSYCELLTGLVKDMRPDKDVLDEQISTALLTGIVAATDRFSNEKTSSRVMTTAAELMGAGANQQLIAVQLEQAEEISAQPAPKKQDEPADEPAPEEPQPQDEPKEAQGRDGELSINHMPRGNLDEVAEQTAEANQSEAAKAAANDLSRQLYANHQGIALPPAMHGGAAVDFEETPRKGSPAAPQAPAWQNPAIDQDNEPVLGGTLNATTEEAAADKRREEQQHQNHTILSHDSGHYLTGEPAYQAPISAASEPNSDEPTVRDIFADTAPALAEFPKITGVKASDPMMPSSPAPTPSSLPPLPGMTPVNTMPPAVDMSPPTLAEIDAQNRAHASATALNDVHAAFGGNPMPSSLPPMSQPAPGGLPPLPPMPDFNSLPPLPGQAPALPQFGEPNPFGTMNVQSEPLGSTLPPAVAPPIPGKADPGQFHIPGQ